MNRKCLTIFKKKKEKQYIIKLATASWCLHIDCREPLTLYYQVPDRNPRVGTRANSDRKMSIADPRQGRTRTVFTEDVIIVKKN